MPERARPPETKGLPADVADKILQAIAALRYGSVEIVVHDGKVVQIERSEKIRLTT